MDWLLPKGTVARNAQIVVKNMHSLMEAQSGRVKELESLVQQLQTLCSDSLEHEIHQLERRQNDLLLELDTCTSAIAERKQRLSQMRETVKTMLAIKAAVPKSLATPSRQVLHTPDKRPNEMKHASSADSVSSIAGSSVDGTPQSLVDGNNSKSNNNNELSSRRERVDSEELSFAEAQDQAPQANKGLGDDLGLEDEYLEESELLCNIRELIQPTPLFFMVHRNNVEEVVLYVPSKKAEEIVSVYKLTDVNEKSSSMPLSSFDFLLGLGAKVIPSHERELQDVLELPVPPFFLVDSETSTVSDAGGFAMESPVGHLLGAIEITIAQDVAIDLWKATWTEDGKEQSCSWATTSVNGVQFAVLERVFVTSEVSWGVPTVTQIDLFARHPVQGHIIVETISASNY